MNSLAIIAGNRDFPILVARQARGEGVQTILGIGFSGITSPELSQAVDRMVWMGLGQLGKMKKILKDAGIRELVMAGQIPHRLTLRSLKFDLEGLKFFKAIKEKNARTLLGGLVLELEREGFQFLDSTQFLTQSLVKKGVLTSKKPTQNQYQDLSYGWKVAKVLADLEAGQTVVVKSGVLIALEGLEGTDEAILRGGALAGKGTTVVKVARSRQDMRYDIPVVGLETLQVLQKIKSAVLGLEAGKTLLLDQEEFFERAHKMGLIVVGMVPPPPADP
ncbi:MAG: UDP-2,3-diacylglucosamine diphosphatase LpxI [Chlamydiae bacterium]|nr:UDP-2,3-diacylglucosamine diphosphatase LpxI [Chlamydiota bacterium]MBI3277543.1 UDP-2,3-diacylglucosamine diphosphatase LpxI [Chlamydiota bacterium]